MEILNTLRELKQKIIEQQKENEYFSILSIIDDAIEKKEKNEFCSISDAARIYLELSSDYNSEIYKSICHADTIITEEQERCLIHFIKETTTLSDKQIQKFVSELKIHRDLYRELFNYISNGNKYSERENDLIKVQGYSAKNLMDCYSLSLVEYYSYMIYLREDPSNAMKSLKKRSSQKISKDLNI